MDIINFEKVSKIYYMGEQEIKAIDKISFKIEQGKFTVILGPSGSGKSTTLNLLGGMDNASSGKIIVNYKDVTAMSKKELEKYRRTQIGFVFQFYNLIPQLTARENVAIAANLTNDSIDVDEIIKAVGLEKRKNLFPSNLSGGELQRLSIARALVKKPKILLCDEPTGALDSETGKMILQLLKETATKYNIALVIVTHNINLEKIADRVIHLKDGHILSDEINKLPMDIDEVKW